MKAPTPVNLIVLALAVVCALIPLTQRAAAQTCVPAPDGLVSWYPGEGNADDQQNAGDGILEGGTTFVPGKIGQAFNFDGVNDCVSVPDISAARAPTFTVEGWFNLRQAPSGGNEYYLASKYAGFAGWIFRIGNNLKPVFSIHRQPSAEAHAVSSVAIPLNTWVHIAATYDGTTAKLYINGILRGSVDLLGGYTPFTGNMKIGTASWSTGGFLPGGADEVSIYERVLSGDEIQVIANAVIGRCKLSYNGSQGCALLRSNLTMWYPAEGRPDDIQRGDDAILQGGATYAPGKVGQAFSFNGTSGYASLPVFRGGKRNPDLSFTTEATVEAWVKTRATNNDFQAIVSSTTFDFIHLQLSGGGNIAIYTTGPNGLSVFNLPPIPQTPTGVWRHIALSIKSGNTRLYVDGNLFAISTTTYETLTSPSSELRIGAGFGGSRFFNGEIDEVGIYHRALSGAEIKAIFNAGSLGKCKPACTALPVGATNWFPGEGNAQDVQGSSNGTPQNGVTFAAGQVGQAFSFSGQNYVNVPGTFGGGPETTVEAWYKTSGLTGDFQAIASSTVSGQFIHLQLSDSGNIVVNTNTGAISLGKVSPAPVGVWHHIALSVKSGSTRLYLDGRLIYVNLQTFSTINPTSNLRIGSGVAGSGNAGRFFKGQIDEVKIYDRALSQSEILTIYHGRTGGSCHSTGVGSNNDFANAAMLNNGSGLIYGTNLGATKESGEPLHANNPGGASVWYRWQAPASGTYLFTTVGSGFDTVLGVYAGAAVNALTLIASNDDNGANNIDGTSGLTFDAFAGTTYYIAVDGASGRTGNIALGWGPRVSLSGEINVSGEITAGNKVVSSVGLIGGDSRGASVIRSGRYSFSNLRAGGNYVLTLDRDAERGHLYDFVPLSSDLSGANFAFFNETIFEKPHVSGRVTNSVGIGLSGVTITISGPSPLTSVTDSDGNYVGSALTPGDYILTPSHATNVFNPPFLTFTNLDANVLGADFTGQSGLTISGQTRSANGEPIGGVTLTLSGTQAAAQQSDASGYYEFRVVPGGPYTIAAAKPGVTFSQPTLTFNSISAHQRNANFTTAVFTISGHVRNVNGRGLSGKRVDLTGGDTQTKTTDADGFYSFTVVSGLDYDVTPSDPNFLIGWFPANSIHHTALAQNVTDDFEARTPAFTVAGVMKNLAGTNVSGLTIRLTGTFISGGNKVQLRDYTTNSTGFTSDALNIFGDYTFTPQGSTVGGITYANFTPTSRSFNSILPCSSVPGATCDNNTSTQNYLGADFTATAVNTLTVASSNPTSGVSITVSPNDNNAAGNGMTQFTRVYNNNTVVSLTAPATATGNNFQKWQKDGADFAGNTSANVSVTMDANHTMTAVYLTPTRTLTVASSNPASGVGITVSPNDNNSTGNGTTQFTRIYNNNQVVSLTAPATASGNTFEKWQKNGVDFATTVQTNVTMDADHTLTAVFVTPKTLQLDSANYTAAENVGSRVITVTRAGDTSAPATVNYATSDSAGASQCNVLNTGNASSRCDYETTLGTLSFAAGEISKTISIPVIDDSYAEGNENFTVTLSNATGASLATPSTATVTIIENDSANGANPIGLARYFVRMHYLDFLNREPDTAGWDFWTNQITNCGSDVGCTEVRRVDGSASFFLSIEFQQTGYLVERAYKSAFGDTTGTSTFNGAHQLTVPIVRFNEFLADTQQITRGVVVLQPGWEQLLESNKVAFFNEFVQRARFTAAEAFPTSMTPTDFVTKLDTRAGSPLSATERNQLISDLTANTKTRAQVLRAVAEHPNLVSAEFNRAFVLMQYFGYLRRNPNDPQDSDYSGYDFWLTKLNQFNGNYNAAEMVKAFISSIEYGQRFGP